jgi:hypothetical protein
MAFLAPIGAAIGSAVSSVGVGTIGTILTGVSALGSLGQGVAGYRAAQQNELNARTEATAANLQATEEASRQRRISRAQLGELKAQAGAQGTTFSGSPMEVYLESVKQAELDAQTTLYGGRMKALGLNQQAEAYKRQGAGSLFGGILGAGTSLGRTLLTGFGPASAPKFDYPVWNGPILTPPQQGF